MNSLKLAFRDEVRPAEYMASIWLTATVLALVLVGIILFPNGQLSVDSLLPLGDWHARNGQGRLYLEIWATILVNANQAAFAIWGLVAVGMAVKRLLTRNKYLFGCFFLAISFIGISLALPSCVQSILEIIVQKFPQLVN